MDDKLVQALSELMAKPKINNYPTYQEVIIGKQRAKLPILSSTVNISQVGQFG